MFVINIIVIVVVVVVIRDGQGERWGEGLIRQCMAGSHLGGPSFGTSPFIKHGSKYGSTLIEWSQHTESISLERVAVIDWS